MTSTLRFPAFHNLIAKVSEAPDRNRKCRFKIFMPFCPQQHGFMNMHIQPVSCCLLVQATGHKVGEVDLSYISVLQSWASYLLSS